MKNLIAFFALSLLLVACANRDEEAKKLGFSNYDEMKTITSLGFKTKDEYDLSEAKKLGFDDYKEMRELTSKGFKNKMEYNNYIAKDFGFDNYEEMLEANKNGFKYKKEVNDAEAREKGFVDYEEMMYAMQLNKIKDPIKYIQNKKWGSIFTKGKCDPLGKSFIRFMPDNIESYLNGEEKSGYFTSFHEFEKLSEKSIKITTKSFLTGGPYAYKIPEPATHERIITLITPGKIKIDLTSNIFDVSELLEGRLKFETISETGIHELCAKDFNDKNNTIYSADGNNQNNFLVGRCSFVNGDLSYKNCNPVHVAEVLEENNKGPTVYFTWGQENVIQRLVGKGMYNEIVLPVSYKMVGEKTIEVTTKEGANCVRKSEYTLNPPHFDVLNTRQDGYCGDMAHKYFQEAIDAKTINKMRIAEISRKSN